ncbi:MAG: transglutaminase-like cysteine peptidase [Desulfobulbaceae bacterium]|nr:transglutaminase-like cysteine peptidase [Desulfobulbaceae bacterium]
MNRAEYHRLRLCLAGMLWLSLVLFACHALTNEKFRLDESVLAAAEKKYGTSARHRLDQWVELIRNDESASDMEKLIKVNAFFNRIDFIDDSLHWGEQDYWATPVEFLASGGGDCEDFSLAKYFTLKVMGVSETRLNLTYVKALNLNQAHMVLTYFETPGEEPLVLDNLIADIKPASQRTDLLPVYSFNGTGLWIAKMRGRGQLVGKSDRLSRWKKLLARMPQGFN